MAEADPREKAQQYINDLRRIAAKRDDLIYKFSIGGRDDFDDDDPFELKALRCFTAGSPSISQWVEIHAFNASGDDILKSADAAYLGREYGVDIDEYENSVEVWAEFNY